MDESSGVEHSRQETDHPGILLFEAAREPLVAARIEVESRLRPSGTSLTSRRIAGPVKDWSSGVAGQSRASSNHAGSGSRTARNRSTCR